MNLQELIEAVITQVRWLARNDDTAREIAAARSGIRISAEVNESGEFELNELKFVDKFGEMYVTSTQITYYTDDNDAFGTTLCKYDDWSGLLLYGTE